MKKIQFVITTIIVFLLAVSITFAQTKSPVEGVWKLIEWREHGDTNTNPQQGLIILTKGYYSMAMVWRPRAGIGAPKDPRQLTDAEKIERFEMWQPYTSISGTYEVRDSMMVMRPIVAKSLWEMNRKTPQETRFKFEDLNTMWVLPTEPSAIRGGLQMKFRRVE